MRRSVLALIWLLCVSGTAATDDKPVAPRRPDTPEQAAAAVLSAVKADDPDALVVLATRDRPDPWLVVDELCFRGEHDAADAFSTAAPRGAVEKLPAYVAAWRDRQPDKSERELFAAAVAAMRANQPQKAIDAGAALTGAPNTVMRLRLAHAKCLALRMLRKPEEAETTIVGAAESAVALGWLVRAAALYRFAGRSALERSAFTLALDHYEHCLVLHRDIENQWGVATALGNLGIVHQELGDFAEALKMHEAALEQKLALNDRVGAAATLGNIGSVHGYLGDYPKALKTFEKALEQKRALRDRVGAAGTLGGIALVHQHLGDYAKALATYAQVLDEHRALDDKVGVANTLGNMGIVHQALGDYANALAAYEQSLAQKIALRDKAGAATTLGNMGIVYRSLGDFAKALATYEKALAQLNETGAKATAAKTLANIGTIQQERGDLPEALATYQDALKRITATGDKAGRATVLSFIASVQGKLKQYDLALKTYETALAEMDALGDKAAAAATLAGIGHVHHLRGDHAEARKFLEKSARAAKSIRATPVLVGALEELGRLHLEQGNPARALSSAQKALDETERLLGGLGGEQGAIARWKHGSLFGIGALAAIREEDLAEALTFIESGRAGALLDALDKREALRWKATSLSPDLQKLSLEAQAAENAARHAYDLAAKRRKLKETRAAAVVLTEASETVRQIAGRIQRVLQHELKQQAGLFYPRAKTIEEIGAALEPDQALVLYALCMDQVVALVLRKTGERVVMLGDAEAMTEQCEALNSRTRETDPLADIAALRKSLVEPLKLGKDVKQVLISPEGTFCYLPYAALFEQTVTMTPSGTTHLLLLEEERVKGKGVLALGDPDYGGASEGAQEIYYRGRALDPLAESRTEVETIGTLKLLSEEASEAGFRKALTKSKRWRAVHFACHGLVNAARPMLSSLALSRTDEDDGFLTALEILRTKIPADLAVLSACETGRGKVVRGEGIVGLTRAFMFAGSPRVICSLWKVDDAATQALMVKFYELWNPPSGEGLSASAALQKAQAHIRAQEKWKHPYYWAAWVLWGLHN